MPELGSRLDPNELKIMELANFEGGYRTSVSNEAVEPNEMPNCINWEYDANTRGLKTADGIRGLYTAPVLMKSSFRDTVRHLTYYQGNDDYLYVTSFKGETKISKLTGTATAMYCVAENENGRVILIATGGKLQYCNGFTLTTIDNSPDCDIIFERLGRYIAACTNTLHFKNRVYYSGMHDYLDWPIIGHSGYENNGKWLDVGTGAIAAIGTLEDYLVVFMQAGVIYTIQNEYPDWIVLERKKNVFCVNRFCVVSAFDDLYFYGPQGFNSFKTVMQYGDFKTFDTGTKINLAMKAYAGDQSRMWYIPSKGQIWVKPRKDGFVYMFHGFNKAFTAREFLSYTGNVYNDVQDVCVDGTNTFVVLGQKITILDPDITTLDGKQIEASLTSKFFTANYHYHIVRVEIGTYNIVGGEGVLMVGAWPIPLKFMDGGICIVDDVDKDINGVAIPSDKVTHTLFDIAIDMDTSSANEPIYTAVLNGTYTGPDYRDIVSHDGQLEGDFHDIWEMPTTTIRTKMNYRTPGFDLQLTIKTGGFSLRYIRIFYREI